MVVTDRWSLVAGSLVTGHCIKKVTRYLLPRTQGRLARAAAVTSRGRGWLARGREFGPAGAFSGAGVRGSKTTVKLFPSLCVIRILQGVYITHSSTFHEIFKTPPDLCWFYLMISITIRPKPHYFSGIIRYRYYLPPLQISWSYINYSAIYRLFTSPYFAQGAAI